MVRIIDRCKTLPAKILGIALPLLNNLWFLLGVGLFGVYNSVALYARFFNRPFYKLIFREDIINPVFYAFLVIFFLTTVVYVSVLRKKATSVSQSQKETDYYNHYPNRFVVVILIVLVGFVAEESLKLLKDEPIDYVQYCSKTVPDVSQQKYREAFDFIIKITQGKDRFLGLESMLPCMIISESDNVITNQYRGLASFDIKKAKPNYLPIWVKEDLDVTDPKLTAQTLFYPIYMAYAYALDQESPLGGTKASCLQRIVDTYDATTLFYIGAYADVAVVSKQLPYVEEFPKLTESQKEQAELVIGSIKTYYLDAFAECDQEADSKNESSFAYCTKERKLKKIKDFVYNNDLYRDYCAFLD